MKVYVLNHVDYDSFHIYGVYTSEEKANEEKKTLSKFEEAYSSADEFELDAPAKKP